MWDLPRAGLESGIRVPCIGRWILNHCPIREAPAILILTAENLDWCYGLQLQTSKCGLGTLWVPEVLSGVPEVKTMFITTLRRYLSVSLSFSHGCTRSFSEVTWCVILEQIECRSRYGKPAILITRRERNLQKCKAMPLSYQIFLFWKMKLCFVKCYLC